VSIKWVDCTKTNMRIVHVVVVVVIIVVDVAVAAATVVDNINIYL